MSLERRTRLLQLVALIAVIPSLVLGWMHMAFNAFAGSRWYEPVMAAALIVYLAAVLAALRYMRMRNHQS